MLEESQICNLHVALKDQFPLPEQTLIDSVRRCFNDDDWLPNDADGFTLIEEKSKDFGPNKILHYYIDQTQDYFLLSRNEFGDKESQSQKGIIQSNFNSFIDSDVIHSINQCINYARLEYLSTTEENIETSCYIDAWINAPNYEILLSLDIDAEKIKSIMFESINSVIENEEISTYSDGKKYEMLFSLSTQMEFSPRGPIAQIRSTKLGLKDSVRLDIGSSRKDNLSSNGQDFRLEELRSKIEILDCISKQCITETMQLNSELGPIRVLQTLEHYKIRMSFVTDMIDFSDSNNFQIVETRVKSFISNTEGVYENKIFTPAHIKDALVLLMIKGKAASVIGIEKVKQYFDKLLEFSGNDKKFIQSVEFNRDNFCLTGDTRIKALMKHRDEAHSQFLQGLIDYWIGASLSLDDPERNRRLLSALTIFSGSDNIRFSQCLQCLVAGYHDTPDLDGNPTRNFPTLEQDNLTLTRLSNIVFELQHYSSELCSNVLWDIEDYLIFRITKHRQRCNSCDFPHIYLQKIDMNLNENDLIEFNKSLDLILDLKQNESVQKYVKSLKECLFVLSTTNLGKSLFERPKEPIHGITEHLIRLLENPIEDTVARYDFTRIDTNDLYEVAGSLVLHLLEPMFTEKERYESMRIIGLQVKDELANCNDIKRELILSFISEFLDDIQDIESSTKWRDLFSGHSLRIFDRLLLNGDNLSSSELEFVLIIAKHVEHVDLYSFASRNNNAREEHSEMIQNIILEGLRLSEIGEILETPESAHKNAEEISRLLYSILDNSNLKLIDEVSLNWRKEEGDEFDNILTILNFVNQISATLESLQGSDTNPQDILSKYIQYRLGQTEGAETWEGILDD